MVNMVRGIIFPAEPAFISLFTLKQIRKSFTGGPENPPAIIREQALLYVVGF